MLKNIDKTKYNVAIVLKAIRGCGGYSSSQAQFIEEVDNIILNDSYIMIQALKKKNGYSPFDVSEILKGGEPIFIPYEEILCIMGISKISNC